MRTLVLLAALALPTAADARPPLAIRDGKPCMPTAALVGGEPQNPGIRKLGDLPPAAQILTVYHTVDNCPEPVVLRREVGR